MSIINSSHKFIFVHVPKAAGTSITSVMSQLTNYCDLEIGGTHFGELVQPAYQRRFGLRKHSTAAELKAVVGDVKWSKYFSFSFVRNPFLRALSTFHFLRNWEGFTGPLSERIRDFSTFEEYVLSDCWDQHNGPDDIFRPQIYWLRSSAHTTDLAVDFVGRVESIDEDLKYVIDNVAPRKIAMKELEVPIRNASKRATRQEFNNSLVVRKIIAKYRVDFDLFGYSYEPPLGLDSTVSSGRCRVS